MNRISYEDCYDQNRSYYYEKEEPKMKMAVCIKIGFGFYLGYTMAKCLDEALGVIFTNCIKKVKDKND